MLLLYNAAVATNTTAAVAVTPAGYNIMRVLGVKVHS
jgi:hypothetical protein